MRSKISQTVLIFFVAATFLFGSSLYRANGLLQKAKELSKEGFIQYNLQLLHQSAGLCERVLSAEPNNAEAKYYLGYNQYRILTISMGNSSKSEIKNYSDSAVENLKAISNIKSYKSEARTLLAAVYMMKLAEDQSEAPIISRKIYSLLAQAKAYNNSNPRIYLIKGTMLYNTPKMFGGSTKKAIANFDKAIHLFKTKTNNPINWGYLETLAWKGQALTRLKKYADAETVYNNALQTEKNFGWVKYKLLPALLKLKDPTNNSLKKDSVSTSEIKVSIKELESNKGKVRIALYNTENNYEAGKSFRTQEVNITDKTAKCSFKNIHAGVYAIKFYHDENMNHKIDKNFFGIPTEDYGFSNNASGNFGPASFEDAKFTVKNKPVSMTLFAQ